MLRFLSSLFWLAAINCPVASSWKSCSEEEGGGICPNETTCCPTGTPGESQCIPLVHTSGPTGQPKGLCCGDSSACRFGYECATSFSEKNLRPGSRQRSAMESTDQKYCRPTDETLVLDPSARDTRRYDLCHITERDTKLYGFPLSVPTHTEGPKLVTDNNIDAFHLAYLSNVGPITDLKDPSTYEATSNDRLENIKKAIIVIHGSLRDTEDYFCAGLSLLDERNQNSTMILAPKFASINDHMEEAGKHSQFLVWDDQVYANDDYLWHIWRYGADAANAPISSYAALDGLVEHLAGNKNHFPHLQEITLVGHSAGGQTLQRWSLLSDSPAWDIMDIRVVAANPRSYAYLDGRRWFPDSNSEREVFRLPNPGDKIDKHCPWYDHWLWGLEDGGEVLCPYRDAAVEKASSKAAIAQRYASRNVIYLSGEYDTIPQTKDHCGNAVQGENRHERAFRFYDGLQEYFQRPEPFVHTFHTIPESNHDHALMFQSQLGRDAILGSPSDTRTSTIV